ncbi:hypothetical protein [Pedobacter gandavensis]|uniref:hypothetical protein n=1 Tax=Pedobacter gandavensis TaxID=2679963 RepID=UPI00292EE902|nr:hypothetical protein [Pedobacter gandavensis]
MKLSYILLGIIIIGLSIFFIEDDISSLRVINKGRIVNMEIVEKPKSCLGTRAKWFMKVKYQDKVFSKQIPSIFCEAHKVGDIVQIRYLEGEDKILLLDEGVTLEFIASGIFILLGLYLIYLGMVNRKK